MNPGANGLRDVPNQDGAAQVASRVVCKLGQGASPPIVVQMAEDCIDDPFTAGVVVEAGHWTSPPADFPEAALDGIGRAHHPSVLGWTVEEAQQAVDVPLQAGDCSRRLLAPAPGPSPVRLLSLIHISEPTRLGMISYAVFCLKKKKKKT